MLGMLIITLFSCEDIAPEKDNPLDPGNEDYVEPIVTLLSSLNNGDTINIESLSIEIEGNNLVSEFRYKLDSLAWMEWSDASIINMNYLDEGDHQLLIQSRYMNGDTSTVLPVSFIVDAVSGPSLLFYPRRHITDLNQSVTFEIRAEEVSNLMAVEIHLVYNPSLIEVISITQGTMFQNGQESIFTYEIGSNSIEILTTLLNSDLPFVNGTGALALIEVKSLQAGSSSISFNGNDVFRDPDNNDIVILEKINGIVNSQ